MSEHVVPSLTHDRYRRLHLLLSALQEKLQRSVVLPTETVVLRHTILVVVVGKRKIDRFPSQRMINLGTETEGEEAVACVCLYFFCFYQRKGGRTWTHPSSDPCPGTGGTFKLKLTNGAASTVVRSYPIVSFLNTHKRTHIHQL